MPSIRIRAVVFISSEKKVLVAARKLAASQFEAEQAERIKVFTPEEFWAFLDEKDASTAANEQNIRGYKVKVKYKAVDDAEKKARKKVIAETILKALRKIKD